MAIDPELALKVSVPNIAGSFQAGQQNALAMQHQQQQLDMQRQQMGIQQQTAQSQIEDRQAQAAERQGKVTQQQQQQKSMQIVDELMQKAMGQDETTGAWTLDRAKLTQAMIQEGHGHLVPQMDESLNKIDDHLQKLNSVRNLALAQTLVGIRKAGDTPSALQLGAATLIKNRVIDASHAQPFLDAADQNQSPEAIGQMIERFGQQLPEYRALVDAETTKKASLAKTEAETRKTNAEAGNLEKYGRVSAPEAKGKWVADYDEGGKPIERWVAEGPGVVVPRQETPTAAQRPLVVAPGAKVIDPTTGATLAEGNAPTARQQPAARVDTVNDAGQPVTRFVEPTAGQEFIKQPEPEKLTRPREVKPGSEEAFVIAYAKKLGKRPDDLTIDDQMKVRQSWARANDKPGAPGPEDDVRQAVAAMKEGTVPPQLPGRASKEYIAVMAEAKRQSYNLAQAATDWTATQKHIATLNGSQQTRIRQAVDNAYHSLDVIEDLSKKWDGGGFPLLNKANLALAKSGVKGQKAQEIATQLEAQISDVTAELGNVYMGGNSPTDHALQLAKSNLSADWSKDTLKAALNLARNNLKIRQNSLANVGVAGASESNPYAAPQPTAAPPAPTSPPGVFSYQDYLKLKGGK